MAAETKRRAPTRAQKQEKTRENLLNSAANQVGKHGYAGASIYRITTAAEIANGTFYNYFDSQQDLFDQLLPAMGNDLLQSIRDAIKGEKDSYRREELGFRAFFDYLAAHPGFYRVLNEAETFAPKAYRDHMDNIASSYRRALEHSQERGELAGYSKRELEVIVYMLISARNYLSYRYCFQNGKVGRLPDWVTQVYLKFLSGGVNYGVKGPVTRAAHRKEEAPRVEYRLQSAGDGWVQVSMKILDHHLDDYGYIERKIIFGLIDRAGVELVASDRNGTPLVSSLSVTFVRPSHVRTLVAKATCNASGGGTSHLSVQVHEQDLQGHLVATGSLAVSLEQL